MKRTLSFIIALLTVFSVVGCGSTETPSETASTTAAVTETEAPETVYPPQVPQVSFDGTDFNVLYQRNGGYWMDDIYAETLVGEIVNDAVYNRNLRLEEKYKINLKAVEQEDPVAYIRASIMASDQAFDLVGAGMNRIFTQTAENLYIDWNTLEYVDSADPWWDSNSARDLSIGNKLFCMAGDVSYSTSKESRLLFISKGIMEEFSLASSRLRNL